MSPAQFVIPSGVAAFVCMIAAALAGIGILKFNLPWLNMKLHMWLAAAALVFGTVHVVLIKFFY